MIAHLHIVSRLIYSSIVQYIFAAFAKLIIGNFILYCSSNVTYRFTRCVTLQRVTS